MYLISYHSKLFKISKKHLSSCDNISLLSNSHHFCIVNNSLIICSIFLFPFYVNYIIPRAIKKVRLCK